MVLGWLVSGSGSAYLGAVMVDSSHALILSMRFQNSLSLFFNKMFNKYCLFKWLSQMTSVHCCVVYIY